MNETEDEHFDRLVSGHFHGDNSVEQAAELSRRLSEDPVRARDFARASLLHYQMRSVLRLEREEESPPTRQPRIFRWRSLAAVATVAALCASVAIISSGRWGTGRRSHYLDRQTASVAAGPQSPAAVPQFALLTAATEARWADADIELSLRGGELPAGPFKLESGLAEFTTPKGAVAVVQGPAVLQFLSADHLSLTRGTVVCRCPDERSRITVVTPQSRITDLGTEFGVDVSDSVGTRVAVLQGAVRLEAGGHAETVGVGQGRVVDQQGQTHGNQDSAAEFSHMNIMVHVPSQTEGTAPNLLIDPSFQTSLRSAVEPVSAARPWAAVEPNAEAAEGLGRSSGTAVQIRALGNRFWPWVSQDVETGPIGGQRLLASVWAESAKDDPLGERQRAILKVVFLDATGHEFADAQRHFLGAGERPGKYIHASIAVVAPAGAVGVRFQVLLNARGRSAGSVRFDEPRLVILPPPTGS